MGSGLHVDGLHVEVRGVAIEGVRGAGQEDYLHINKFELNNITILQGEQ